VTVPANGYKFITFTDEEKGTWVRIKSDKNAKKVTAAFTYRNIDTRSYKGIQGGEARTVCSWVKVPKDFSLKQGFGIISWGNSTKTGETWQISVNPLEKDGEVGRLRLGLRGSQIIGNSDLRDGLWHHIAVVLYGGSNPNIGTHALLYVDGKKESVSRASLQEVKTTSNHDDHGLWVGRNVTYKDDERQPLHGGFFRGGVDDLYIFNVALSQNEIQSLMEKK
ncbi:LamG domain-containing protein, partial [Akkermansiaceae bacterium]|nr:LamG domain-containing protein [Akkermansiaceae bacterium]